MAERPALEHIEQAARGVDPEAWGETVESTAAAESCRDRSESRRRRSVARARAWIVAESLGRR